MSTTTITVQWLGGARAELTLPRGVTADVLRAEVAKLAVSSPDAIKLVHKGATIVGSAAVDLNDGDTVLAMPQRKAPAANIVSAAIRSKNGKRGNEDDDEEEEPDEPARLPAGAPRWEVVVVDALRRRRCPPWVLEWVVLVRPMRVAMLALFCVGCVVTNRFSLGPVFVLGCMVYVILTNLGQKKEGEVSAYSIFNDGVRRLPGQLDADQLDQEIRRGQM